MSDLFDKWRTTPLRPYRFVNGQFFASAHLCEVVAQHKVNDQSSAIELMAMSANNRVDLLRTLTKAQALQLIDDIMARLGAE